MKRLSFPHTFWLALAIGLLSAPPLRAADAALDIRAQLIWATDGDKPTNSVLKELDADTQGKLKKVFKWKNYYQVSAQEFQVPQSSQKRVEMSEKCQVTVENLGSHQVEVQLFGKGKMVVKKRQILKTGELLILAGDDKDNNAWFVILTLPKHPADAPKK